MRDINRIEPFLDKFKELWLRSPDLRFGQLVSILSNNNVDKDMFYIEDGEYLKAIEDRLKPETYVYGRYGCKLVKF